MTDLEREEKILKKALEDYTAMLPHQEEIYQYRTTVQSGVYKKNEILHPYSLGLCGYLSSLGNESWEIRHLIPVYFEVSGLGMYSISKTGNLSIRIEWMKRALELIKHRKYVEEYKKLGNPKFKYSDDTYNRERVKEAIWK